MSKSINSKKKPYTGDHLSNYGNSFIKRAFDIAFVMIFSPVILFAILLIVICIKRYKFNKVFFTHRRIGKSGTSFSIYKFRTKYDEQDSKDHHGSHKFLELMRNTHIDEIPQFYNVLIGDMSLVGPRPYIIKECEEFTSSFGLFPNRHSVKPGITGLAQINYNHDNSHKSMNSKLAYDLEYIDKCSFLLDISVLVHTLNQIVNR